MIKPNHKPTRSPAQRVRVGKEERRSERALRPCARRDLAKSVTTWAVPFGCGLLFLFLLNFVFFVGYVPSASMEPAIKQDSFIFGIRVIGEIERGDVVVFWHEDRLLVKRIAAMSGDKITVRDEVRIIPSGCYFMLGDNAAASIDSR